MNETVVPKPGSSMERVALDAERLGLVIELKVMDQSTRTAEDAAAVCGCGVGQIVKSLIFENADSGALVLVLVAGDRNADLDYISATYGLNLKRCDGRRVRDETGFAIGGVAPIGHKAPIATWLDESLLTHDTVWAAAGRPDGVFRVDPDALAKAINASVIKVGRIS